MLLLLPPGHRRGRGPPEGEEDGQGRQADEGAEEDEGEVEAEVVDAEEVRRRDGQHGDAHELGEGDALAGVGQRPSVCGGVGVGV